MVTRLSLIRQKQIQWAREREDLKAYGGLWGGVWNTQEQQYRPSIRSQFRSTLDLPVYREEEIPKQRRTPSLPPLPNNHEETGREEEVTGGDTSGYASDSCGGDYNASQPWPRLSPSSVSRLPRRTPDSISSGSGREERARWGDRGVGVGHLWEPSPVLPPPPLPRVQPATPSWIQRGLQEPPQVLVISHGEMSGTPSSQGTSRSCDTPLSSEGSQRSYIRGQNVPLDPAEVEERERKRLKALELQEAIKKQLEEKERQRRAAEEREAREERAAEERLRRQQELERQRLEEEKRRQAEKQEKEERIAKAMREALEAAEKAAVEEKARARRKHLREMVRSPQPHQLVQRSVQQLPVVPPEIQVHRAEVSRLDEPSDTKSEPLPTPVQETPRIEEAERSPRRSPVPVLKSPGRISPRPRSFNDQSKRFIQAETDHLEGKNQPGTSPSREILSQHPKADRRGTNNLLQEEKENVGDKKTSEKRVNEEELRAVAEELELSVRLEQLEIEACNLRVIAEPGRLLTPSKFRLNRGVERSTQTDHKSRSKTTKSHLRLEEKPKWGVNRPAMQYIKASDRDPFRRSRMRNSPRDSRFSGSSRSPSPMDESKASFRSTGSLSFNGGRGVSRVTRGVGTPRVMQVLPTGIIRKSSAGRRVISIKGSIGVNGGKRLIRQKPANILPKNLEASEFLTVNQVLTQLMDLKQGLKMKQKEWEITRSPTPFSEIS